MRGPTSCVAWVTRRNENYETLCYGTGLGYMVFWRQNPRDVSAPKTGGVFGLTLFQGRFEELTAKRLGTGCEITCMVCDNTEEITRLAIATRDRMVQVWRLDLRGQVQSVFSVQLDVTVPKGVAFVENAANDIHVFGLYDGNLYVHLASPF